MQLNALSRCHLGRLRILRKGSVRWFVTLARFQTVEFWVWNNATIICCVDVAERADKMFIICVRKVWSGAVAAAAQETSALHLLLLLLLLLLLSGCISQIWNTFLSFASIVASYKSSNFSSALIFINTQNKLSSSWLFLVWYRVVSFKLPSLRRSQACHVIVF